MSRILKSQLVRYSRRAHERGLTAAFGGNLSVRSGNLVFIKATGAVMDEMTAGQVAVIDMNGRQISGVRPSSEYRLHLEVYGEREDVKAIAHLHPPYSIAVSGLVKGELPILTPEAELYLGRIPVAPFRPAGTRELADVVAEAIKNSDAAIMERHGIVTVGRSLREAFYKAELVEESAKLWYLTRKE
ncbi:aldolase [Thermococcus celer]|uniref:Fuculose phosphate aldolase n=1 Tax=Thermococcus celer Vu 13 = JCM 8558 TaxID=1293037 RepID=A0A218P3B4_THECE|nr:aldolase [Thermococcus celer]ASI99423.1 fuculose phosphate aldolase [Thermococcus celer Vu 13 = JCM 8558]